VIGWVEGICASQREEAREPKMEETKRKLASDELGGQETKVSRPNSWTETALEMPKRVSEAVRIVNV